MGLFDFLGSKKKEMPVNVFSDRLTTQQKAAVNLTMISMLLQAERLRTEVYPQKSGTKILTEESGYMDNIKHSILGLTDKDLSSINIKSINYPQIVNSLSISDKSYFASVFYGLASIRKDQAVLRVLKVVVGDMGYTIEELAEKDAQTQKEINDNPYMGNRYKT